MAPPVTGVAINVTISPVQISSADAAILTDGVILGVTLMTTTLLDATAGVVHGVLVVITHITLLPLAKLLLVNVGLLGPTFIPSTIH